MSSTANYPKPGQRWKRKGGVYVTIVSTYGGWSDNYDDDITITDGFKQQDIPWSLFKHQYVQVTA